VKVKKIKTTLQSLMTSVLSANIKSSTPLFAENKEPLETLKAEKEKRKE
jgi:hypothetical protein